MHYVNLLNNRQNSNSLPSVIAGLDQQLESLFSGGAGRSARASALDPDYRWYDKEDFYLLQIDLPGLSRKDIELEWRDGLFSIEATRTYKEAAESEGTARSQQLKRSFDVPDDVAQDRVSARYEDGVLTLNLPKQEEKKPRKISVS